MSLSRRIKERQLKNLAELKAKDKGHNMTGWTRDVKNGHRLVSHCVSCGGTMNIDADKRLNGTALTAACKERMKNANRNATGGGNRKVPQKKGSGRQYS